MLQRILSDSTRTFVTIGLGAMLGQYVKTCGGPRAYHLAGASVGWRQEKPGRTLAVEGQMFTGSDESRGGSPNRLDIRGEAIRFSADFRYAGAEVGLVSGPVDQDGIRRDSPQPYVGVNAPILGLRLGPPEFFIQAAYGDNEIGFPPRGNMNLRVGFQRDSGRATIRLGVSDLGPTADARIRLRDGVTILPTLTLANRGNRAAGLKLEYAVPIRSYR